VKVNAHQILLDDPGLAEGLNADRLTGAVRDCLARTIELPRGPWTPSDELDGSPGDLGLLVLRGLLVRRVGLAARFGAELLGEGDLLRPWQRDDVAGTLPRSGGWRALEPCRLAVLDHSFALRAGRYPEVISCLFSRVLRRSRALAVTIAIVRHPRVDLRLHMLFWELADRWGRVHRDGVRVPLRLTHAVLADLVAAQRQTVSKALRELAARQVLVWTGDAWLLSGGAPSELEGVRALAIGDHPSRNGDEDRQLRARIQRASG
jgi:CRP/FNR family transcriptional regulator, cyclic AMP receptor protein